jgi:NDP-sugar pyrophosphorylase family protein
MLNIVIPMAGAGSRFAKAGFSAPKPLIEIHGVPMIKVVISNLRPACKHRFIFICQQAHVNDHGLRDKLGAWAPGCSIVEVNGLTEGAACTVLAAASLIDNDDPLMIANSDQYVDIDINTYLARLSALEMDGLIMTMTASDPKWSFVGLDEQGRVSQVVEKRVISHEATVGIYNYKHGRDFICATRRMMSADDRVNGEFYVAPTYNYLINVGKRIGIFNVGAEGAGMHGLGIPQDLRLFLAHPTSRSIG